MRVAPLPPTIPGPAVHLGLYALTFTATLLAGLGLGELAAIERTTPPESPDHRVWSWAVDHRGDWPAVSAVARRVTRLGDSDIGTVLVVAIAAVLVVLGRRPSTPFGPLAAVFWVGTLLGARLLTHLLKTWFERERPLIASRLVDVPAGSFSFPSGHSLSSAAFLTLLAVLLVRWLPRLGLWRFALAAACPLLAVLIGLTRVWLGVHYLTDVLAGLALGASWALAAAAVHFGRGSRRRQGPPPPSLDGPATRGLR